MSEQTKEQQLESTIVLLKARLFDVQDEAGQLAEVNKSYSATLAEIAQVVGITGESVTLTDLVDTVKALVPEQGELDVEVE